MSKLPVIDVKQTDYYYEFLEWANHCQEARECGDGTCFNCTAHKQCMRTFGGMVPPYKLYEALKVVASAKVGNPALPIAQWVDDCAADIREEINDL